VEPIDLQTTNFIDQLVILNHTAADCLAKEQDFMEFADCNEPHSLNNASMRIKDTYFAVYIIDSKQLT
jgi:hypothetical protein